MMDGQQIVVQLGGLSGRKEQQIVVQLGELSGQKEHKSVCRNLTGQAMLREGRIWEGSLSIPEKKHTNSLELENNSSKKTLRVEGWSKKVASQTGGNTDSLGTGRDVMKLCKQGRLQEALHILDLMDQHGIKAYSDTYYFLLQACINLKTLVDGKRVHAHIIKSGLKPNVFLGNTLVNMYMKCVCVDEARQVFDHMIERNVFTWTILIAGYAKHGFAEEAFKLLWCMEQEGVKPDKVTLTSVLKACASLGSLEQGQQIHAHISKSGFESDVFVGNALVDMYAKCGSIEHAQNVFEKMLMRNVVSWTTMISGYAKHGHGEKALKLFRLMQQQGMRPNEVTFGSILIACTNLGALEQGKQIHACIIDFGFESDIFVGTSLVDMYAKCGSLDDARKVFDEMPKRDIVSWNAMIAGYTKHGHEREALKLFQQMEKEGEKPNRVTLLSILKACANLALLGQGKQIHGYIIERGFESDGTVGNSLVDMYAKCGNLELARQVFDKLPKGDVVVCNAMLAAYAQHGHGKEAIQVYEHMRLEDIKPDGITFIALLSACSHTGLVDEGRCYFDSMSRDHRITPTAEHYCCMIDLLGRAGRLEEAEDLINKMPFQPSAVVWTTLLGACRIHGQVEVAKRAAKCVIDLQPENDSAYVLLSNTYAAAGRWEEKAKVVKMMENRCVKKAPGHSSIVLSNEINLFFTEDTSHPQRKEVYAELKRLSQLMEEAGFVRDMRFLLHVVAQQNVFSFCLHSEKLAIAFGLISTPAGSSIRVIKNLRVCEDCHTATKLISNIVGREIVVRDVIRFHHFKDGVCSCGDYW